MHEFTCSHRLGIITEAQFQAALDQFDLGRFVDATPIPFGLFGQNVFVTSTAGAYVLRGCPHYPDQFPRERFIARQLHEQTRVPVPWPYLIDPSPDLFGWSYALMPRLPGLLLADRSVVDGLTRDDRLAIARALGRNLAMMQELHWPVAGSYDLATDTIQPFDGGYLAWVVADVLRMVELARRHNDHTTAADAAWVEEVIEDARAAPSDAGLPSLVHSDYGEHNVVVSRMPGAADGWRVSGVVDLMEAHFGDPIMDLGRQIGQYLLVGDVPLARAFVAAYREQHPISQGAARRFPLAMLRDRLLIWEYFQRPGSTDPPAGALREWVQPLFASNLLQ